MSDKQERVGATEQAVELNYKATRILTDATSMASDLGRTILGGAHVYLLAALLADFVRQAQHEDWIGPSVRMGDSTVKPTDEFLMDHMFGVLFKPIAAKPDGAEFLSRVRTKASKIIKTRALIAHGWTLHANGWSHDDHGGGWSAEAAMEKCK